MLQVRQRKLLVGTIELPGRYVLEGCRTRSERIGTRVLRWQEQPIRERRRKRELLWRRRSGPSRMALSVEPRIEEEAGRNFESFGSQVWIEHSSWKSDMGSCVDLLIQILAMPELHFKNRVITLLYSTSPRKEVDAEEKLCCCLMHRYLSRAWGFSACNFA